MNYLAQIRRERLALLRDESGNAADLARRTGKDRRQISAWLAAPGRPGAKAMKDDTAREIEVACLKPLGWLDGLDEGPLKVREQSVYGSHYGRTDRQKMADAVRLLQELAELQGVPGLVSDPTAISIAYDFLMEFDTPVLESNVLDITKRLAAKLRGEANATPPERSKTA